ncbi:Uncharacterized protein dnm_058760 [Desulfonema magnum]|uniref:Uncharacterized protein n=1 Tax=Desulfonema magnum TaxID=45655 RepID=A0A975GQF0_9BACT|nr:Uncharacterized protein dnm_058760 [Desulfonema magnum]
MLDEVCNPYASGGADTADRGETRLFPAGEILCPGKNPGFSVFPHTVRKISDLLNSDDLPVTTNDETRGKLQITNCKSQITNDFYINGHDLPVTTKYESFAVFPNT